MPEETASKFGQYSRYKLTDMHTDDFVSPGTRRLGLWKPPYISLYGYTRYMITEKDLGRLDYVAFNLYQNSRYWWVLAWINQIKNPLTDLSVGQVLICPTLESIQVAFSSE